jgi:predicted DNA-binding protein
MNIYNNLLLNDRIDRLLGDFGLDLKFKSHILYIIFHIRTYPFKDRNYEDGDFVPVKVEYLRSLISSRYTKTLLEVMVKSGVLECDNRYIVGEKSKGYRIDENIKKVKFYLEPMEDLKLATKIKNKLDEAVDKVLSRKDGYAYITKCMLNLDMDYEKADKYLNSKNVPANIKKKLQMMVDIFHNKFATVDDKGNRLHNNLTNIATPLRDTLNYNGHKLVQCDLKNSQPLLFRILLNKYHLPQEELDRYLDVVCNIGFYEFFAKKLGVKLTQKNRGDFKKKIFGGVLFDRNRNKLSKYEKVFEVEFPLIFHCMRDMKKDDYKNIPISLQKLESTYIFTCVDRLRKENKDIELLTIHDSVCCIQGKEQIVYKVMMEEFYNMFSILPKIKIEKFG